ncbi:beta-ketoacyl-[acyl-carrier-protein] synthase family protein [Streptomyces sp. NPDC019890]|uniref:beta-ketoacyl-[acyl-carrier-protein] synthase family protein n=1 Tax=Streptomyces sp. NPDC019890 TaxID=3365064 RepID=UPI0038515428
MIEAVITGLGATTPLGGDAKATWAGLLAGQSGITRLQEERFRPLPVRVAGRMAVDPATSMNPVEARRLDRASQAAVVAAREAWRDAGLDISDADPDRVAVVMGTGIGGVTTLLDNHSTLDAHGHRRVSPRLIQMNMPNGSAAAVSIDLGARGGVTTPVSACASGAEAIAHALDLIRLDRADIVIAGGTEACVLPLTIAGFSQARAMSVNDEPHRASRPFDKNRDGFVLSEGSAVLILERASSAAARARRPYVTLAGAHMTSDAHDMVAPDPTVTGQVRAIRGALLDGDLDPGDISHVNAHATSTPVGDALEAQAIASVFGSAPVVSATKSMTGHLIGASGALEALATVLAVHHDVAPPTPTLDDPDDNLAIDVTRAEPRRTTISAAVSNSFGFGGHNVALAFRKA